MKIFLLKLLLLIGVAGYSQSYHELLIEYQKGEFEYVIEKGVPLVKENYSDIDYHLLIGRAYADNLQYKDALPYLKYVDQNAKKKGWRRGWGQVYLGICNFGVGQYEWSRTYLNMAASDGSSDNIRNFAKEQIKVLGFGKYYQDFMLKVDDGILFHFHPDITMELDDVSAFVEKQKSAFKVAKNFFNCTIPKDVDFFVWNTSADLMKQTGSEQALVVKPGLCVIHAVMNESAGNEFSHIVSYYLSKSERKSALISKGTALYLARNDKNLLHEAKTMLDAKGISDISVNELWIVNREESELHNSISGAFVQYLIDSEGKDKFIELYIDQTYYNAKKVYGNRIDELILEFESKL